MSVPPADNGQGPRVIDFREVNETTVMRRVPPSRAQQRVHDHKRRTGRDPAPGQLLRWRREARRARRRRIRIAVGVVLAAGAGVVAELAGWWPW